MINFFWDVLPLISGIMILTDWIAVKPKIRKMRKELERYRQIETLANYLYDEIKKEEVEE